MDTDKFGVCKISENDLYELLYKNLDLNLDSIPINDPEVYNESIKSLHAVEYKPLQKYIENSITVEEFDTLNKNNWFIPNEYKHLDIAKWVLDQCTSDNELQRCGEELILYQERNLFDLLRFLKYFVDHLRQNNMFWGVGRGSSVSSYVLYKIGIHKIDSLYYNLDIKEFLK